MNKDLKEFMNNLTIKEDISKYKDEKGNVMYIPTNNLYASCSYLTLTVSGVLSGKSFARSAKPSCISAAPYFQAA